jgi:hypothetical protein
MTVLPLWLWAAIVGAVLGLISPNLGAEPQFKATADGVEIYLHNEKCAVKEISNLPNRATWVENGKTTEGCFGGHPDYPVVIFYFADRTAVILHKQAFSKVTGV